jgi:hypothetical protein
MAETGWIILTSVLAIIIIIFLLIGIFSLIHNNNNGKKECSCYGHWGVIPNHSATILNRCGTDHASPCNFEVMSLDAAITECNNLKTFCDAFIYNENTQIMSIVDKSNSFEAPAIDLFARQHGVITN